MNKSLFFWFLFQYPYMVDFILVGPLTNFAMCINMYGDEFLSKVRNIYIMGGNYRGECYYIWHDQVFSVLEPWVRLISFLWGF